MKTSERDALLRVLGARFEQHPHRHPGIPWAAVQARLEANPRALESLHAMEATGGEPHLIGRAKPSESLAFVDCSAESPAGRRSTCYDAQARKSGTDWHGGAKVDRAGADQPATLGIDEVRPRDAAGSLLRLAGSEKGLAALLGAGAGAADGGADGAGADAAEPWHLVMLLAAGATVMFVGGVSLWYFGAVIAVVVGAVASVFLSRGTPWQLLHDYQYRRIDTFLDPSADPLGAGYNIIQDKIALGSGGWSGKGFMPGTQSRLNFLPEKHTDFIFTTLAEEFGFVGAFSLLAIYALIIGFCLYAALQNKDRFSSLLIIGGAANFFFYIAVNLSMVMGTAPVVGVPLPLLSYGGSAMLVILVGFGLVQSAYVHRPR